MSKISLQPNASGTGTFTLAAPNSNTNRTLTLPDEAGSVLTDVSDLEPQVKTATNATGSAPVYACRAWVNFDGTGTVAIRASGNVSSITDRGTGKYTVNFTTAIEDINYSPSVCGGDDDTTVIQVPLGNKNDNPVITTSSFTVNSSNGSTYIDFSVLSAAVFR
jgi:hypothetical protein